MTTILATAPAYSAGTTAPVAKSAERRAAVKAADTAQAFEAVLIGQMTNLMMESAGDGGEFSGGNGELMFRGVLAEKLGTEVAKHGGLGLAPSVMQEIIRLQEGKRP